MVSWFNRKKDNFSIKIILDEESGNALNEMINRNKQEKSETLIDKDAAFYLI